MLVRQTLETPSPIPTMGSASAPLWVIHIPRPPASWFHQLYNTSHTPDHTASRTALK